MLENEVEASQVVSGDKALCFIKCLGCLWKVLCRKVIRCSLFSKRAMQMPYCGGLSERKVEAEKHAGKLPAFRPVSSKLFGCAPLFVESSGSCTPTIYNINIPHANRYQTVFYTLVCVHHEIEISKIFKQMQGPEIKLPTFAVSWRRQRNSRKTSTSTLLTALKPLTVWITTNCGKFLKRWECPIALPVS